MAEPTDSPPRCRTCRFWQSWSDRDPSSLWECHRAPPALPTGEFLAANLAHDPDDPGHPWYGVWPMTRGDDWCGEHRPVGED